MRHRKTGVKLGRTGSHRNAMFRNMVTSLLRHDRIRTTDTKAKELRRWADHVITLAKRGDLHARRQALAIVNDKSVVHKLFDRAQELFGDRAGGYTRLIKLGRRAGDAAPMTMVELVIPEKEETKKKKKDKTPKKQAPAMPAVAKPAAEDKPSASPAADKEAPVAAKADQPEAEVQAEVETPAEASVSEAEEAGDADEQPSPEEKEEGKDV